MAQPADGFVRKKRPPHEVWADAWIEGTLLVAPDTPSLPNAGEPRVRFHRTPTGRPKTRLRIAG